MQKVVLAFDSFKGSLSALEITSSLTQTIQNKWPACEVCSFPIADGGEGTVEAIERNLPVTRYTCCVHDPLLAEMEASYIVTEDGTAVIEMAAANGLPLVPLSLRNPMETTTLGTGELIADALDKGCRTFIIGLGGSATNDAGIGVMHALGVRFLDEAGNELLPVGKNLSKIKTINQQGMRRELADCHFVLACDVNNPFYGPQGAAYVFAPQKGADAEQVEWLDRGLRTYADCLNQQLGKDIAHVPGAGAAGGMGGGLLALLDAELKSGIDIILDLTHFDEALCGTDVVLTGEGKIDAQTGMGKALNGVLKRAQKAGVPVVGIGGSIEDVATLNRLGFTALFSIQSSPVSLEEAMVKEKALHNLNQTVVQLLRLLENRIS